ncbi:hypothetical protein [Streptomyces sp. NPDC001508]|uniref:hypothetical protein n=1 Tax=Streptomyces sp. NPDC001508 TaxID=3154656 RepID=UPI00332D5F6B
MTGAAVVDERNRVLCLRHEGGYALAETEPEDADGCLTDAARAYWLRRPASATYGRSPAPRGLS